MEFYIPFLVCCRVKEPLVSFDFPEKNTLVFPPHSAPFITGWCRETYSSYISCNCSGRHPSFRINYKRAKMNYFLTVSCLYRPRAVCLTVQHSGCLQIYMYLIMNQCVTFNTLDFLSGQEAPEVIPMLPLSLVVNLVPVCYNSPPVKRRRGALFPPACEAFIPSHELFRNFPPSLWLYTVLVSASGNIVVEHNQHFLIEIRLNSSTKSLKPEILQQAFTKGSQICMGVRQRSQRSPLKSSRICSEARVCVLLSLQFTSAVGAKS